VLVSFYGCKKGGQSNTATASVQSGKDQVEDFVPPTSKYETVERCPVGGEKVIVGKNTLAAEYKGKEYYFCCPDCEAKFKSQPDIYRN